jgi:RNA polymerase sigma-70 factor (ECF subfamily)
MRDRGTRDRERDLLRRLADGDLASLDAIWTDHADRAWRHALAVTTRREDADDVVQTVFVRLAGLGAELLGVRDLAAYLGAMVHHEALASRRRLRRSDAGTPALDSLLGGLPSAESTADARRLAALVAALPDAQREVVVLHVWGGFTFREIARITGVSLFTAASRYRLGTKRLRDALTGVAGRSA